MEETLIEFETGVLSKQKGFDVPCDARWWTEPCAIWQPSNQGAVKCNNSSEDSIARPTQSLLKDWLRIKHNLKVNVDYFPNTKKWGFTICDITLKGKEFLVFMKNNSSQTKYASYEEAKEKALQHALNLI